MNNTRLGEIKFLICGNEDSLGQVVELLKAKNNVNLNNIVEHNYATNGSSAPEIFNKLLKINRFARRGSLILIDQGSDNAESGNFEWGRFLNGICKVNPNIRAVVRSDIATDTLKYGNVAIIPNTETFLKEFSSFVDQEYGELLNDFSNETASVA